VLVEVEALVAQFSQRLLVLTRTHWRSLANLTHSQDQVQIHWLQYHLS